jgi:signal transduction histidine kinase
VEVQDRGIGIHAEDLPKLFTPFFRTDRSRSRASGGVGLGLAMAKRIVEAHGGTVAAESQASAGTTFRFTLPAAEG